MKPFKSKLRLAVSALILISAVVAVACLTTGCSDSSEELANQIKAKEAEISKLQSDQNQLVGMYNQLQSQNSVASQPTQLPNYQQEGSYQPAPAQPAPVVVQSPQSNSDGALMGGVAGFMLGQAISNSGGNNSGNTGGGYNSNSRTVINRTIINQPARPINPPSTARLPTTISKPSLPVSKLAPISKPSTFTRSISSSPRSSYSFTRRR